MTVQQARDFIEMFTLASTEPVLTDDEVDQLLSLAKRQDFNHFDPTNSLWTPTFNLAFAVRMGWRQKLAKLAMGYDIDSSTQSLHRSQMFKQCQEMVKEWGRMPGDSIQLIGSLRNRFFVGTSPYPTSNASEVDLFLGTYWDAWGGRNQPWWQNPDDIAAPEDFNDWGYSSGYNR